MSDEFEIRWQVEDGYFAGGRPQHTKISWGDYEPETEDAVREAIEDAVRSDFESLVSWGVSNYDAAVEAGMEWIRSQAGEEDP